MVNLKPLIYILMQKKLIFLLAFMVLIALFALQNSKEVEIKLWFWTVRTSMVLVLILTFAIGAIAGILFSLPKRRKKIMDKDPGLSGVKGDFQEDLTAGRTNSEDKAAGSEDEFEDVRT